MRPVHGLRTSALVFIAVLASLLVWSAPAPAQELTNQKLSAFRRVLAEMGYLAQDGSLKSVPITDLFCQGVLPSGYAYNHDSPYWVYVLPPAVRQTAKNTLPFSFRLDRDEAVVLLGMTPPQAAYFSFRSYLGTRWFPEGKGRRRIFASLGDTINNLSVNVGYDPSGAGPFKQPFAVITAADQGVAEDVQKAMEKSGFSPAMINLDIIPEGMVRLGWEEEADELVVINRVAFIENPEEKKRYFDNPCNAIVLRLTPDKPRPPKPFPFPKLRVRGTGETEFGLWPGVQRLEAAILERYKGQPAKELETSVWLPEGFEGIQRNLDVLAEDRDTVYLKSPDFHLEEGEFVIVYGVNHQKTGKAAYGNLNVYSNTPVGDSGVTDLVSVASLNTVEQLDGTAADYLPSDPQAGMYYAYKIARSCAPGEKNCLALPPQPCPRVGMKTFFLAYRAYLEYATQTGPSWQELVYDRAIKFGGK